MELNTEQIKRLKDLMRSSARKGNLANSGMVLENGVSIAEAESLVVSNCDATAHSERMLVEKVCKDKKTNYTPGLVMITVCEPCLMCLSACSWAGYDSIVFIIPAKKYFDKIPWLADTLFLDKNNLVKSFTKPLDLIHLNQYEEEFSVVFEEEMKGLLV